MSNLPPSTPISNSATPAEPQELSPEMRRIIVGIAVGSVIVLAIAAGAVYLMVQPENAGLTATIRDVFIIFMALESLVIGFTLIILMIQIARLTNLLQHEIKPILQNTNETINTVRGTAIFVSENLVDPVMKLNGYLAAIGKLFELFNVIKK